MRKKRRLPPPRGSCEFDVGCKVRWHGKCSAKDLPKHNVKNIMYIYNVYKEVEWIDPSIVSMFLVRVRVACMYRVYIPIQLERASPAKFRVLFVHWLPAGTFAHVVYDPCGRNFTVRISHDRKFDQFPCKKKNVPLSLHDKVYHFPSFNRIYADYVSGR